MKAADFEAKIDDVLDAMTRDLQKKARELYQRGNLGKFTSNADQVIKAVLYVLLTDAADVYAPVYKEEAQLVEKLENL